MKKLITFTILATIFATLTGTAQAGIGEINCLDIQINPVPDAGTTSALMAAQATPATNNVPDAGTTSALMGMALAGLAVVRRFVR
jgi:VPDSG-CTERM motif